MRRCKQEGEGLWRACAAAPPPPHPPLAARGDGSGGSRPPPCSHSAQCVQQVSSPPGPPAASTSAGRAAPCDCDDATAPQFSGGSASHAAKPQHILTTNVLLELASAADERRSAADRQILGGVGGRVAATGSPRSSVAPGQAAWRPDCLRSRMAPPAGACRCQSVTSTIR